MSLVSGIAIFFIIWWLVLFVVLPLGVRNAHEAGETVETGNEAGAPVAHGMKWKMAVTTLVAGVVFAAFYVVQSHHLIETMNLPFLDKLPRP